MSASASPRPDPARPTTAAIVERNIRALIERRQRDEQGRGLQDRLADTVTRFAGSMPFVYLHLVRLPRMQLEAFLLRAQQGLEYDDIAAALATLKRRGARLIDEAPRAGGHGMQVAFVHPSSTSRVLVELAQAPA